MDRLLEELADDGGEILMLNDDSIQAALTVANLAVRIVENMTKEQALESLNQIQNVLVEISQGDETTH